MQKKIIFPILGLILAGAVVAGVTQVKAQSNNNNPYSGLVQMIAQKFGLDQNQVQAVANQYRDQQKQNRQQTIEQREQDRLDKLVQAGKITDAQKQAILNELTALKNKYNPANLKSLTPDQRKQQFQAEQQEIQSWAKSQGIDPGLLMPGFGMGGVRGMHRGFGGWLKPQVTPTPVQ